mmetsp:Transcript_46649/g.75029  ORF Transcript_46649/g.75029 Transcript_46649/m.75029 type:complete len:323 (+) Transcript_46649:259-1227(+)
MLTLTNLQLPQILPQHDNHLHGTKRRVKAACTNCKKAKARCDQQRPCSRCVQKNCAECVDAFPRRVGRRRNHYLNKIVTENEVKASGALIKSQPKKRKRRRSGKAKKSNDAKESQTPPLRAKKFKSSTNLTPLKLDTTDQDQGVMHKITTDQDLGIHQIMERAPIQPAEFSGIDLSIFEPSPPLQKLSSSEDVLTSQTGLSTPKNFPFGEPDSNLFDGTPTMPTLGIRSDGHQVKESSPYPLKETSNDEFLFNERAFMEPVSQDFTESHSDTASDSELSTDNLFQVQDVGELNDILPIDGFSWMEGLQRDESTVFGMDSILC